MIGPLLELAPNVLSRLAERLETSELRLPTNAIAITAAVGREIPNISAARVFFQPASIRVVRMTCVSTSSTVRATISRSDLPRKEIERFAPPLA